MVRSSPALAGRTFDLLVVGGGVYGLTIAYDAAQRGLQVALVERDDFGSGISFNHARTIHGGLRYLQSFDLARSRESIRERRTLARIAPHAVTAVPFVLPLTTSVMRSPLALRTAFLLDRVVARDRNQAVPEVLRLPAGAVIAADEATARFPLLAGQELAGAAIWYDYVTTEADRLTLAWGLAAIAHGATLANYTEAVELVAEGGRAVGVRVRDHLTGEHATIHARLIVCACGAGLDRLLGSIGLASGTPLLEAMNLIVDRTPGFAAVGGRTASGKTFFMVPYHRRVVCGTWESTSPISPDADGKPPHDIEPFLKSVNEAFPAVRLTRDEVSLIHRGLVPAAANGDGTVRLEGHEQVRDYRANGIDRLVTVSGAKYTTARGVAERVTDRIVRMLDCDAPACRTADTPLTGSAITSADVPAAQAALSGQIPSGSVAHLISSYGGRFDEVAKLAMTNPDWCEPIDPQSPVIGAELVWAVRHEMCVTLGDAVIRRTPLGAVGRPSRVVLERAARLVGDELGWPEERRRTETAAVEAFYDRRATAP